MPMAYQHAVARSPGKCRGPASHDTRAGALGAAAREIAVRETGERPPNSPIDEPRHLRALAEGAGRPLPTPIQRK